MYQHRRCWCQRWRHVNIHVNVVDINICRLRRRRGTSFRDVLVIDTTMPYPGEPPCRRFRHVYVSAAVQDHDDVDVQTDNPVKASTVADAAVQTDVDTTSPTADFIVRVRRCEMRPSKVVGWGMVYLNQEQELSYVNHRRKLQAPLSFLDTIDEDSVLEFIYEEPEEEPCGMVYLNQDQEISNFHDWLYFALKERELFF